MDDNADAKRILLASAPADWRGAKGAVVERRRRKNRGAEGAEGVRCGEGVSPSSLRVGSGEGAAPRPQKNFGFLISKW